MVYRKFFTFKTGRNYSLLNSFPYDGKYTGTQKLLLIRSRIFGDKIGGTEPSGMNYFRRTSRGRSMLHPHKYNTQQFLRFFPGLQRKDEREFQRQFMQQKFDRKQGQRIRRQEAKQRQKEKK